MTSTPSLPVRPGPGATSSGRAPVAPAAPTDTSVPGRSADVLIYGATAAGVMAAVAAANTGVHVTLVDPDDHVGGMVSGGLSRTDYDCQENLIGGLTRQFFEKVGSHYGEPLSWVFEPHVAQQILNDLLDTAGVARAGIHHPIASAHRQGSSIDSIQLDDGSTLRAKVFIDASYEGDLMAAAGVSYQVGRESRDTYGEPLAGRQENAPFAGKQFDVPVSPVAESQKRLPVEQQNQLLPLVSDGDLAAPPTARYGVPGQGDHKVGAYSFRLCVTDQPELRVAFPPPANYDPNRYELLKRYLQAKPTIDIHELLGFGELPNHKFDLNDNGAISTNHVGGSWEYPDASPARRRAIWTDHRDYEQGLLYFLSHDSSVPAGLQQQMQQFGLARDEFTETGNWPSQLYVREGRRMLGSHVLTQQDLAAQRHQPDSVGMAGYNIDAMPVQRISVTVQHSPAPFQVALNEGYITQPVDPYQIPYRSILPRREECDNLLVPVCLSASHIAYSSVRMEPNYMLLGHSAGTAAALAVQAGVKVHDVRIDKLQRTLRQQGQILQLP